MNPPIMMRLQSVRVRNPCRFFAFSAFSASCSCVGISPYFPPPPPPPPPFAGVGVGAGTVGNGFFSRGITCGGAGLGAGAGAGTGAEGAGGAAATTGTGGRGVCVVVAGCAAFEGIGTGGGAGRSTRCACAAPFGRGPGVTPLAAAPFGPSSLLSSALTCVAGLLSTESVGLSDAFPFAAMRASRRASFSCAFFSARAWALARLIALLVGGAAGSLRFVSDGGVLR